MLSHELKSQISLFPSNISFEGINEIIFYHVLCLRYVLNRRLPRIGSFKSNDENYSHLLSHNEREVTFSTLVSHFNGLENALGYAYILNKKSANTQHLDNLIMFEDLALLTYTQIFARLKDQFKLELLKAEDNPEQAFLISENDKTCALLKSIVESRTKMSKTSETKLPGLRKNILKCANRFVTGIILHNNLMPDYKLSNYEVSLKAAPKYLSDFYAQIVKDNSSDFKKFFL